MSKSKPEVSQDEAATVGGGACTASELVIITTQLTDAYEALIDFTSHVIERVAGDPPQ
jgi:hypothetical protein